jgi:hypothetical protein
MAEKSGYQEADQMLRFRGEAPVQSLSQKADIMNETFIIFPRSSNEMKEV